MNTVQIVLLVVAAMDVLIAAWWGWRGYRAQTAPQRLLQGPSTQGTVVDATAHPVSDATEPTAPYTETIEFSDGMGTPVRGRPTWQEPAPASRRGETVTVYYDRERPATFIAPLTAGQFQAGSGRGTYLVAGSMAVAAVVIAAFALLVL